MKKPVGIFAQFDSVSNSERGAKLHFKLQNSIDLAYLDPDTKEKPITVTMKGVQSDAHKSCLIENVRKERSIAKAKAKSKVTEDADFISDSFFDDQIEPAIKRLVAVVTEWENMDLFGDGELECTPANVELVFRSCKDLRDQALNFLNLEVNFI